MKEKFTMTLCGNDTVIKKFNLTLENGKLKGVPISDDIIKELSSHKDGLNLKSKLNVINNTKTPFNKILFETNDIEDWDIDDDMNNLCFLNNSKHIGFPDVNDKDFHIYNESDILFLYTDADKNANCFIKTKTSSIQIPIHVMTQFFDMLDDCMSSECMGDDYMGDDEKYDNLDIKGIQAYLYKPEIFEVINKMEKDGFIFGNVFEIK